MMKRLPITLAVFALAAGVTLAPRVTTAGDAVAPNADAPAAVKPDARAPEKPEAHWVSLAEGMKLAAQTKKPMIVDVYTSWCGWCRRMDQTTYQDPRVIQALNEGFIAVKLNAESNTTMMYKGETQTLHAIATYAWGIDGYPTTVFLKPDGEVITPIPGYIRAQQFANLLHYIGTGSYEAMKFDEFIRKNS